jgi:cytochrome b
MADANDTAMIRVWDPLIRIGHWVLVVGFATACLTEGEPQWLHSFAGYAIAVTVAIRILWGIVGPRRARFSDFVTGPARVLTYLRDLATGRAERHVGHSPAGGAMTVALLFALALTAISGMANLAVEEGEGPLAGIVTARSLPAWMMEAGDEDNDIAGEHGEGSKAFEEIHEIAANATLLLVVLHLTGVLWASRARGENLARTMITGLKCRNSRMLAVELKIWFDRIEGVASGGPGKWPAAGSVDSVLS